jgi:hypothetical protein
MATSASAPSAKPGATVSLFVDVIPDPKIHVYAPGAKDYLPIALEMTAPAGVKLARLKYPKSQILVFEPLKERIPVYSGPFRLVQDATLDASLKAGATMTLTGVLKYRPATTRCASTPCRRQCGGPSPWPRAEQPG